MSRFKRIHPGKAIRARMSPAHLLRFLKKVRHEPSTGCWIWTGCTDENGYGQFRWDGRAHWAHRLSFHNFKRDLEAGVEVDHGEPCHNPSCVNPDHLRTLTRGENAADGNRRRALVAAAEAEDDIPF